MYNQTRLKQVLRFVYINMIPLLLLSKVFIQMKNVLCGAAGYKSGYTTQQPQLLFEAVDSLVSFIWSGNSLYISTSDS